MASSPRVSAGILLFRRPAAASVELFLVHPGGPFFASRDQGVWSVPKGEVEPGEDLLAAAVRELAEEVGLAVDPAGAVPLGSVRQKSGKVVHAWAVEVPPHFEIAVRSNTFEMEWPPRSGRRQSFPEVDRGAFVAPAEARALISAYQAPLIDRLLRASG
jgi:predicted NUDIX family NTP pyrophosphohydrolase